MKSATIKSLERGLQIMNILSSSSKALSLNEISAHFEIDRSSVFRLLSTLLKNGFVLQDSITKHYSLGYKLLELSGNILVNSQIETVLRPIMRQVCEDTRQNTHCAVLDGTEVVFIAVELPKNTLTINISVGTREPAASTALGRAILAYMPRKEQEENLDTCVLTNYTEKSVQSKEQLIKILDQVQKTGIAFDNEEYKEGVICFAAPVFNHQRHLECSLGISGHRDTIMPHYHEYSEIVRKAGYEASKMMGLQ